MGDEGSELVGLRKDDGFGLEFVGMGEEKREKMNKRFFLKSDFGFALNLGFQI